MNDERFEIDREMGISFWLKISALTEENQKIIEFDVTNLTSYNPYVSIKITPEGKLYYYDNYWNGTVDIDISIGEWNHFIVTMKEVIHLGNRYRPGELIVYKNGKKIHSSNTESTVGWLYLDAVRILEGTAGAIKDLRIFGRDD